MYIENFNELENWIPIQSGNSAPIFKIKGIIKKIILFLHYLKNVLFKIEFLKYNAEKYKDIIEQYKDKDEFNDTLASGYDDTDFDNVASWSVSGIQ